MTTDNKMIVIKIKGGLGNQLFQYALGVYIKHVCNIVVKYDISYFNIRHNLDTPRQLSINRIIRGFASKTATTAEAGVYKAPAVFDKTFLGEYLSIFSLILNRRFNKKYYLQPGNRIDFSELINYKYLDGYWQAGEHAYKVIDHIINDMDKDFIAGLISPYKSLGEIKPSDICVHIRRGDYVSKPSASATHGICSIEYYKEAIAYFKTKFGGRFFFFSDDISWVKSTFGIGEDFFFVDQDVPDRDLAEFFLMTTFSNFVIANSTYSWWAAVISKSKNVIAPKQWFVNGANELALEHWRVI